MDPFQQEFFNIFHLKQTHYFTNVLQNTKKISNETTNREGRGGLGGGLVSFKIDSELCE